MRGEWHRQIEARAREIIKKGHRTICSKLHAKPPGAGTRLEQYVAAETPPGA